MLPAALPNARTARQRSVETMQRGRLPRTQLRLADLRGDRDVLVEDAW